MGHTGGPRHWENGLALVIFGFFKPLFENGMPWNKSSCGILLQIYIIIAKYSFTTSNEWDFIHFFKELYTYNHIKSFKFYCTIYFAQIWTQEEHWAIKWKCSLRVRKQQTKIKGLVVTKWKTVMPTHVFCVCTQKLPLNAPQRLQLTAN